MSIDLHFVDTETTGLIDEEPEAEITELAVVKWNDGDSVVLLHERIRPKRGMPENNAKFNKSYTPEAYKGLDVWDLNASQYTVELLKGALICGSNPDFDKRMIAAECYRTGAGKPQWHHRGVNTCTLGMLLWCMGETEGSGLAHLTKHFGIEHAEHTAMGDCMAAIGVWEAFFDRFIFHPRLMKEALEYISNSQRSDYASYDAMANVLRENAFRTLAGIEGR